MHRLVGHLDMHGIDGVRIDRRGGDSIFRAVLMTTSTSPRLKNFVIVPFPSGEGSVLLDYPAMAQVRGSRIQTSFSASKSHRAFADQNVCRW
jgi:hypothetical protein